VVFGIYCIGDYKSNLPKIEFGPNNNKFKFVANQAPLKPFWNPQAGTNQWHSTCPMPRRMLQQPKHDGNK
jgi:hypothetical protein